MFSIGERVKINLHDKSIIRVGKIIGTYKKSNETIYIVRFKSGAICRFVKTELLKIDR